MMCDVYDMIYAALLLHASAAAPSLSLNGIWRKK